MGNEQSSEPSLSKSFPNLDELFTIGFHNSYAYLNEFIAGRTEETNGLPLHSAKENSTYVERVYFTSKLVFKIKLVCSSELLESGLYHIAVLSHLPLDTRCVLLHEAFELRIDASEEEISRSDEIMYHFLRRSVEIRNAADEAVEESEI